jgi:hypothetical protein
MHLAVSIQLSPSIQSLFMRGTILMDIVHILDQIKTCNTLSFLGCLPDAECKGYF